MKQTDISSPSYVIDYRNAELWFVLDELPLDFLINVKGYSQATVYRYFANVSKIKERAKALKKEFEEWDGGE